MSTFQKFIQYYKPYKKVFIFDLICAAFISLVDLAYPQILRSLTKTLFLKDASTILKTLPMIGGILFICYIFQASGGAAKIAPHAFATRIHLRRRANDISRGKLGKLQSFFKKRVYKSQNF
mgnify:CR=1 FL=1